MSCIFIDMFTLSCNRNKLLQVSKISLVVIIYLFSEKIKSKYFSVMMMMFIIIIIKLIITIIIIIITIIITIVVIDY